MSALQPVMGDFDDSHLLPVQQNEKGRQENIENNWRDRFFRSRQLFAGKIQNREAKIFTAGSQTSGTTDSSFICIKRLTLSGNHIIIICKHVFVFRAIKRETDIF